jgi:pimeloyl-ACP methyl ester carboxylesterase/DNA-binding CsgD family transcriptional regulator
MSTPEQQIRFCTSRDGVRLAYAVCGSGPALVWLGHWVRHLKFDGDSPIWRPWLSLLTRRNSVVRYDWRGCGLSDREGVEFSLERHIQDLEAVVDDLALKRFILVGDAGGGVVAMAYAARHPERVSHLVLYGTQTRGVLARRDAKSIAQSRALLEVMEIGWDNPTPAYGEFFTTLHMPDTDADRFRSYGELLRLTTSPANAVALLKAYYEADVRNVVSRIRCPALVLHAREDAIIPFDEGRLVASLIPGARFVPLESRNHILQESEPAWQQLASQIDRFLPDGSAQKTELPLVELTPREREVLDCIAQGLDNHQIAERFGISEKTVRNHASVIFEKIGAKSRAHAVALARDAGLGVR